MTNVDTNSAPTAQAISDLLTSAGIEHGPLHECGSSNNDHFTDGDQVFVKVCPRSDSQQFANELTICRTLAPLGLSPAPLHEQLLRLGGHPVVALEWRESAPVHPTSLNTSAARSAVEALARLHRTPVPAGLPSVWDRLAANAASRVASCRDAVGDDMAARLAALTARWIDTLPVDAPVGADAPLVHGDAQCGNLLLTEDGKFDTWCDFEGAGRAPREWDIAALGANLLISGGLLPNRAAWFVTRLEFDRADPVDWNLVDRLFLAKLTSTATYRAGRGDLYGARTLVERIDRLSGTA